MTHFSAFSTALQEFAQHVTNHLFSDSLRHGLVARNCDESHQIPVQTGTECGSIRE
jgi:hypothetical protein